MALTQQEKISIIKDFQTKEGDTGSSKVQIALLTFDINKLQEHFKYNKKDRHSRRGLIRKVSLRRKLLNYLSRIDNITYKNILQKLNLRR